LSEFFIKITYLTISSRKAEEYRVSISAGLQAELPRHSTGVPERNSCKKIAP
jgi:hypothetical protein